MHLIFFYIKYLIKIVCYDFSYIFSKKYINLKNSMNLLELLFMGKKNTQQIYDLINKCKEEIAKIKEINIKEKR